MHNNPRPITYGSEICSLTKAERNVLKSILKKVLRVLYGPAKENGIRRNRYDSEIYNSYD